MASYPPFHLEDQTDEDFFDKLVEDDDVDEAPVEPAAGDVRNDSDDSVKAFANLAIDDARADAAFENSGVCKSGIELKRKDDGDKSDVGTVKGNYQKEGNVVKSGIELKTAHDANKSNAGTVKGNYQKGGGVGKDEIELKRECDADKSNVETVKGNYQKVGSLVSSSEVTADPGNHEMGWGVTKDLSVGKGNGATSLGIKEVDWNAFYTNSGGGEGYSEFFSDFGNQSGGDFAGKAYGDSNDEVKQDNGIQCDGQYQEGQGYDASLENSTSGQDVQDWENLYPGWKYDYNTGQWYQVDDVTAATQGSSDANSAVAVGWTAASDATAEVSYMQQTSQSVSGTLAETGTESVSSWNQVLQGNSGYPEHMYLDPQYPGWYYDTIAQEWRSLDSYNSSVQSTAQGLENGHASTSSLLHTDNSLYPEYSQAGNYSSQDIGGQAAGDSSWSVSYGVNHQQGWDPYKTENANRSGDHVPSVGNKKFDHSYGSNASVNKDQQSTSSSFGSVPLYNKVNRNHHRSGSFEPQSFAPTADLAQHLNCSNTMFDEHKSFSSDYAESQKSFSYAQQSYQGGHQYSYAPHAGRSSAGRPPHALVTFGFGGKLVVMKGSSLTSSSYGSQDTAGKGSISVLNVMEVVTGSRDSSSVGSSSDYFHALTQQSFPGPLVGGSVGSKDLYKWIDERVARCGSSDMDYKKGERLRLLLSLLKIACQHYGKLRSPFGSDNKLKENDTPESAVAKLFASAKTSGQEFTQYGVLRHCLQNLPSEGQMRATACEVQNLLVSGRRKEALQCAQEGQLWGPALVIASQLGEQLYVDTVKQMALRQLVAGSPLRTLCLLIAGQPAEVFSSDSSTGRDPSAFNMPEQSAQLGSNAMLDDWEENLAVITANRTKDDELVIVHLGDCLWKERSEITAAHICYLVAEASFESYSDTARLCLLGADHWKFPRTYASPEAIQRTELYEYSKVIGNSQFILLPFQPYKLIYAYMLAEVGKVSDSLKYCQAALKSLKTGRNPEVEIWKQLVLSLEERIRTHQQGGYAANLAPAKLVGKLLNFFDSTAHKVVGGLPPPAPSSSQGTLHGNEQHHYSVAHRVSSSQSTMAMSSLVPSASMEPISEWTTDSNRMTMSNRSVSEPDFGRSPRQETSSDSQGEAVSGGTSRFSRFGFGSQLLQKTMGLVLRPRSGKQAKLGEKNKFYYDEKLKRWVEEGAEPPAEETALPPPPTTAVLQNGSTEYNLKSALKTEASSVNGGSDSIHSSPELTPGMPPIPPSTNQFSARSRMGVRSRYVDTFNQGGGSSANFFQTSPITSPKPALAASAKFFIPSPVPSLNDQTMTGIAESNQGDSFGNENPATSPRTDRPQPLSPKPPLPPQRISSMGHISNQLAMTNGGNPGFLQRRTASWDAGAGNSFSPRKKGNNRPLGEVLGMPPSTFMPNEYNSPRSMPTSPLPKNGSGSFGDLQDVEL
ncbi:hypothetical protein S83_035383 [Arachis hypogaea]|uniref:Protein transport protein sec16 n=1 Tax=Arachis hypogaea TaxID=3818 RepID=A0A445ASC0_ARAHY|nr:uncharacterized protein DS421_11g332350 [Arachis hypogaea]RYR29329.1 hypothetical protein Ahy_B01g053707 [Arachis hypogaea]